MTIKNNDNIDTITSINHVIQKAIDDVLHQHNFKCDANIRFGLRNYVEVQESIDRPTICLKVNIGQGQLSVSDLSLRHEIGHVKYKDFLEKSQQIEIYLELILAFLTLIALILSAQPKYSDNIIFPTAIAFFSISAAIIYGFENYVSKMKEIRAWRFAIQSYPSKEEQQNAVVRFIDNLQSDEDAFDRHQSSSTHPSVEKIVRELATAASMSDDALQAIISNCYNDVVREKLTLAKLNQKSKFDVVGDMVFELDSTLCLFLFSDNACDLKTKKAVGVEEPFTDSSLVDQNNCQQSHEQSQLHHFHFQLRQ